MAKLKEGLNLDTVPDRDSFEPLPFGTYTCVVLDTKMKQNKNGSGEHLSIEMEITSGDYSGRKIWDNLNLFHESEVAQRIARQQFKQLCIACGITGVVDDTDRLHGKEVDVILEIVAGTGGYSDSNNVMEYHEATPENGDWSKEDEEDEEAGISDFDDDSIPF